jgi:predicted O-linked N-acetylglucosamine transferase (SPINDLY family)
MNTTPARIQQQIRHAVECHTSGDLARARSLYQDILRLDPRNFDALHLLGVLDGQRKDTLSAIDWLRRAIAVSPDNAAAMGNLGAALIDVDRAQEAIEVLDRAVQLAPNDTACLKNRAAALRKLGRLEEAAAAYRRLLVQAPHHPEGQHFLGVCLSDLGRHEEAIGLFRQLISHHPRRADTFNALGRACRSAHRPQEALAAFRSAVALNPEDASALNNMGEVLNFLGDTAAARQACEKALHINPDMPAAHNNLGNCHFRRGDLTAALASYTRALELKEGWVEALCNRAMALCEAKRPGEASRDFDRALEIDRGRDFLIGDAWYARQQACDWSGWAGMREEMITRIQDGQKIIPPFPGLMLGSASTQQAIARTWSQSVTRDVHPRPFGASQTDRSRKIRVAYLSADFRRHAVLLLSAGLFASHDRDRFDLTAIFHSGFAADDMTHAVSASFDRFITTGDQSEEDIVKLVRGLEIDIAIDLMGYTRGCIPRAFKIGLAPVQINFLGFPATMGASSHAYIIADRMVIPRDEARYYDEAVIWMPDTYLPSDNRRGIGQSGMTRAEAGLPPDRFVFCCLNNTYKLTPVMFDLWARILNETPEAVLWLQEPTAEAEANLRREMEIRGVASDRLLFARKVASDIYLERYGLADLFLDTLPHNAHTTASDALWAGLPLLTLTGDSFASRVAASLLQAVGLPELITTSAEAYVAKAVGLARNRPALSQLRARLAANRRTHPLFDTGRYTRNFEKALLTAHERRLRGLAPEAFAV